MKFPKEVIIFIPAKKNSERLKNKNFKKLNKKPLIEYTFSFIKKIGAINQSIVSTDSHDIKNLSKKYNIKTILRPKNLAKPTSSIESAITHFLNILGSKKFSYKWVLLLQPTSPLRDKSSYIKAIKNYKKYKGKSKFIISLSSFKEDIWKSKGYFIERVFKKEQRRQQDRKNYFIENGMYYFFEINNFLKTKKLISKKNSGFTTDKINSIDINDKVDFKIAESLIK